MLYYDLMRRIQIKGGLDDEDECVSGSCDSVIDS